MAYEIEPIVLAKLKKDNISGRHWSVDQSNDQFYTKCRPDLLQQYNYIKRRLTEYFEYPRLAKIYDAETLYTPSGGIETVQFINPTCDCDDFVYEYGKHTGIRISALMAYNIFDGCEITLWPNGSHMAPDYHVQILGKQASVEIKSVLVQDSGSGIKAQYNNAVHNKNAVERDLMDVNSEFCSTFCVFIYYYVDVKSRMVVLFDADIVAMPVCLDYKIRDGRSVAVMQKSDGPNAVNTSATVGVRIRGKCGAYNTMFDMYYSFLTKQPCVKLSGGVQKAEEFSSVNTDQAEVKLRLKRMLEKKKGIIS